MATVSNTLKAFTVEDNSMSPDFTYKDEIIIDTDLKPDNDEHVLVRLGTGQMLFRQYRPRSEISYDLVAVNPDWPTALRHASHATRWPRTRKVIRGRGPSQQLSLGRCGACSAGARSWT